MREELAPPPLSDQFWVVVIVFPETDNFHSLRLQSPDVGVKSTIDSAELPDGFAPCADAVWDIANSAGSWETRILPWMGSLFVIVSVTLCPVFPPL